MDGISLEDLQRVLDHQRRCVNCGAASRGEIHHRIFRSAKGFELERFLEEQIAIYKESYGRELAYRTMHDRQNLVRLCGDCHGAIHRGDRKLRDKFKHSFTCPITGYNVPFKKLTKSYQN